MTEKTEWYPGNVRPVRVGVYETESFGGKQFFQHWNGEFWGRAEYTPENAELMAKYRSYRQDDDWRGLKEKSE